nr:immunoglobulin heavy chain junction region [Macaca mulatta]MOV38904.1 immunoglobulin heavy chain junction region [Macaca mulatta]MOV41351.1 immunoglobulin heavy chain junction region [Macaca mulatta]MOV41596.1 immunoglobulin heavy chain junction region [Macaca mulatta]MOV42923.1 immunoglobulin heavy chain junction region [Macaca mulatta]
CTRLYSGNFYLEYFHFW